LLDKMKEIGFRESTRSGLSVRDRRPQDARNQEERARQSREGSRQARKQYERGIITNDERYNKVIDQ